MLESLQNRRFYKVISLSVKAAVVVLSFCYLFSTLRNSGIEKVTLSGDRSYVVWVSVLMLLNWALESRKWQVLVEPLEKISFTQAAMAVLTGVTVSIFSPNRMGEFAGRVFFLRNANRLHASALSLFGSFIQLCVTVVAGLLAYYILQHHYYNFFGEGLFRNDYYLWLLLFFVAGILLVRFSFRKIRPMLSAEGFSRRWLRKVCMLSLVRYLVFGTQYFLLLQFFNVTAGPTILACLIALTFFVTSAVPTFALTEVAVRGAAATYFFGTISGDTASIALCAVLLWLINLAVPAVAGSFFVWKMDLFGKR